MREKQQALLNIWENINVQELSDQKQISLISVTFQITNKLSCIFNPMDFIEPSGKYRHLGLCLYIGNGLYCIKEKRLVLPGYFILTEIEFSFPSPRISHHVGCFMENPEKLGFVLIQKETL